MADPHAIEASLVDADHLLISDMEPARLGFDFFGAVVHPDARPDVAQKTVYLAGDHATLGSLDLRGAARVLVIEELSRGYGSDHERVDLGRVPVRVGNSGVLYRRFFADANDYFHRIGAEHTFQALTESTKPSTAHRTGIYLTPVSQEGDALRFRLLRCSTNLAGPTEGFGATDEHIVDALNREAGAIFRDHAPLNHVLAQICNNTPATEQRKQTKASISAHADKTKDMPRSGIMAFCTFYDGLDKLTPLTTDPFDLGYKGTSGLTRLRFRLKEAVGERSGLIPAFSVTLYPSSVFFMPLSTNRLYTHEVQAASLDAARLPTRLGYVVRCSKTEAVHAAGTPYLDLDGQRVPLEARTDEGVRALRALYADENRTDAFIDYGDRFRFSMNEGDYLAPDRKRG
ncbi:MAG: hypothetical protein K8W52_04435 [Deltaproteobacteria bacterium]|nr:hypothetical protein [Deltaproteobacteria bacterium]